MPTTSWTLPASGFGYARDVCLAALASGVSGITGAPVNLVTASYEPGDVFIFSAAAKSSGIINPTFISPFTDPSPAPNIFGYWVFTNLSGAIPTATLTGGLAFLGGGTGGSSWVTTAFTGNEALQFQINNGGIVGFDTSIPGLNYSITGTETFTVQFQVTDSIPNEVFFQLYDSVTNTWRGAYLGPTELTGLANLTGLGNISPIIGQWQTLIFTASQVGLSPGAVITGLSWGAWNTGASSTVIFSDTSSSVPAPPPTTKTPSGYIDCDYDGIMGFYVLSHFGPLIHVPTINLPPVSIQLSNTPSFDYTGLVYNTKYNAPYFIGYDGTIYNYNYTSNVVNTITAPPSGVAVPARWMYTDNVDTLYTMFSNSNKVASYNLVSSGWTTITSPFNATLDTVYYSKTLSSILAGGSNYQVVPFTPTILDMAFSPLASQVLVLDNTPRVALYNVTQGVISFAGTVSGFSGGSPVNIASTPSSSSLSQNQALVTDTTNNRVDVLTYLAGVWNQTSTVPLTAPSALTIFTSGVTQALVCQPTNNTLSVLTESGTSWSVTQTLSVNHPNSVAVTSSGTVVSGIVATSSGVTFLGFNGVVWNTGNSLSLSPTPTIVATDQALVESNPLMYGAATNGSNTTVYIFQNSQLLSQYTISNDILGTMAVVDWEIIVPAASGDVNVGYYVSGLTGNALLANLAPANPVKALWLSSVIDFVPILLIAGPNTIWSFYNSSPQSYARITDSLVGIYSGATWTTIDLNNRNKVSSITTDPSGNIFVVCVDNELYKYSSGGVLSSGYPAFILPPPSQTTGVPLGFSKLVYTNNSLYSATSMAGGVVTIIP